jgi:hypothetical protein
LGHAFDLHPRDANIKQLAELQAGSTDFIRQSALAVRSAQFYLRVLRLPRRRAGCIAFLHLR